MNQKRIKELKDLNLMDRFLFAEAIEDKETYEALLEIILEKDINLAHTPQAEKEIRTAPENRRVILDVCGIDEDESIYNTEVQNRDTKNLPKRSRYHNGMIDSRQLEPGTIDFNQLKDVYVILIMPFDLFGQGRYKYTFTMQSEEIPGLHLNDGVTRIFLNTRGTNAEGVSEELISMLGYFEETTEENASKCNSERIKLIHKKVKAIKNDEEMGVKYMNAYEERILDRQEAFEEGKAAGKAEGKVEGEAVGVEKGYAKASTSIAMKLKESQVPFKTISDSTGLSIEEIEKL